MGVIPAHLQRIVFRRATAAVNIVDCRKTAKKPGSTLTTWCPSFVAERRSKKTWPWLVYRVPCARRRGSAPLIRRLGSRQFCLTLAPIIGPSIFAGTALASLA